jgi:enamine deaminase RidA (YjgF/YER057c/UK114 family)
VTKKSTSKNHSIVQPGGWAPARGYSNGIIATGRQLFIAGQIGWDANGHFHSDRFSDQVGQALRNILDVLTEAGGRAEHIVRLTWYITSRDEYLAEQKQVGAAYRAVLGKHFPVMSVVQVVALIEARAKVEIEATAVLPQLAL